MIIPIVLIIIIGVILLMASGLGLESSGIKSLGLGSQNIAGSNNRTRLTKNEFFSTVIQYGKGYDWDITIPLAMSALETNYSRSCYFHNLFNITIPSSSSYYNDPGQFFKYSTIPSLKFKKYIGYNESVAHFWNLLKLPRYQLAYTNRHNPGACITALINAGYAGSLRDPSRYLRTHSEVSVYYNQHFRGQV